MKVVDDEDGTVTNMDRLLTKEEVAELLGVKVTWLNSEIQAGRIPHLRLGSRKFIRFTREQVDEFLDSRTVNVTAGGND
jgi:excisionase family DNA binding protein